MGLKFETSHIDPLLWTGKTLTSFHSLGNLPDLRLRLKI